MSTEKKVRYTNEQFVQAWRESSSCDDVGIMCNMAPASVRARAAKLRKAGVKLPKYARATRAPKVIDVDSLNAILEAGK